MSANLSALQGSAGAIEQLKLRLLLFNCKKSVELWFLGDHNRNSPDADHQGRITSDDAHFAQVQTACVEILGHNLREQMLPVNELCCPQSTTTDSKGTSEAVNTLGEEQDGDRWSKFMDDFEWLRRSAQIRESSTAPSAKSKEQSVQDFLHAWTLRNLKANCLCACMQALITDKELLHYYYEEGAFLRSDVYATALCICLSSLELNQCILLSQVESDLYNTASLCASKLRHRRSSSHPNFSISPPKATAIPLQEAAAQGVSIADGQKHISTPVTPQRLLTGTPFPTFRKIKSLPMVPTTIQEESHGTLSAKARPRSKTLGTTLTSRSQLKRIPQEQVDGAASSITSNTSSFSIGDIDIQPSTTNSASSSNQSQCSNHTLNSNASSPSTSTSLSDAVACTTTARKIELINCDDIKIWTDLSCEHTPQDTVTSPKPTDFLAIPQHSLLSKEKTKSFSPLNSFLNGLFSTPPTYTSWLQSAEESDTTAVAAADTASYPCNNAAQTDCGAGVFDSFLPVCGNKLRSRKSQNLFEDSISSLDCTATTSGAGDSRPAETASAINSSNAATPKDCQSLTAFLQMAQLSRNNTELEKENAHFRVSEAIISAMEHMKWAKMEPDKWRRQHETTTATDWLEKEQKERGNYGSLKTETEHFSHSTDLDEHIPYAEIDESSLDLPSAEVVGLSLISKFNDKHLPKVSELKWLVSEEDAPQQLLPMPDSTSSANPDESIVPSRTRGTQYWAPPRQQIIFTDHPPPNRKDQILKQNNRCAGCGMRVSPQHLSSFRYCTYLGKYHCTGCHRNQISAIPAKILKMWNFKCYPVSVFAYRLLEQMFTFPLFYVPDLNPALYFQNKSLLSARCKRLQLRYMREFIKTCRFAVREQRYFESIPDYIPGDHDTWSMSDFIDVYKKSMHNSIDEILEKCKDHIFSCVLCTARGFLCEYCRRDQVIYPWQNKTFRCDRCGSCFHLSCWKSMLEICCRCQRISKRKDDVIEL